MAGTWCLGLLVTSGHVTGPAAHLSSEWSHHTAIATGHHTATVDMALAPVAGYDQHKPYNNILPSASQFQFQHLIKMKK